MKLKLEIDIRDESLSEALFNELMEPGLAYVRLDSLLGGKLSLDRIHFEVLQWEQAISAGGSYESSQKDRSVDLYACMDDKLVRIAPVGENTLTDRDSTGHVPILRRGRKDRDGKA